MSFTYSAETDERKNEIWARLGRSVVSSRALRCDLVSAYGGRTNSDVIGARRIRILLCCPMERGSVVTCRRATVDHNEPGSYERRRCGGLR